MAAVAGLRENKACLNASDRRLADPMNPLCFRLSTLVTCHSLRRWPQIRASSRGSAIGAPVMLLLLPAPETHLRGRTVYALRPWNNPTSPSASDARPSAASSHRRSLCGPPDSASAFPSTQLLSPTQPAQPRSSNPSDDPVHSSELLLRSTIPLPVVTSLSPHQSAQPHRLVPKNFLHSVRSDTLRWMSMPGVQSSAPTLSTRIQLYLFTYKCNCKSSIRSYSRVPKMHPAAAFKIIPQKLPAIL